MIRKRRADVIITNGYRSLLFRFLFLILVLYILFSHVFLIAQVTGNEMFPALEDGDVVLAFRLQSSYTKNDVIVNKQGDKITTGRILGRDGDAINMDDSGTLQVNGTNQGGEIMYPTYAKEGIVYAFSQNRPANGKCGLHSDRNQPPLRGGRLLCLCTLGQ